MKKWIVTGIIFVAGIAIVALANNGPQNITIQNTSEVIMPEHGLSMRSLGSWQTNTTYGQGTIVKNNNRAYWAVSGGTSSTTITTGPTNVINDQVEGSTTWRVFNPSKRKGGIVVNDSTNVVYVSLGYPAKANKGIRLNANGGALTLPTGYDGSVHAIATMQEDHVIAVQEW